MTTADLGRLIKDLREKTGAGITDCKKALDESGGRLEDALTALRNSASAAVTTISTFHSGLASLACTVARHGASPGATGV